MNSELRAVHSEPRAVLPGVSGSIFEGSGKRPGVSGKVFEGSGSEPEGTGSEPGGTGSVPTPPAPI